MIWCTENKYYRSEPDSRYRVRDFISKRCPLETEEQVRPGFLHQQEVPVSFSSRRALDHSQSCRELDFDPEIKTFAYSQDNLYAKITICSRPFAISKYMPVKC